MLKKRFISATLAMGMLVSLATAASADSTQLMTSFDASKNSWFLWAGAVTAISGENLTSQDGWLARVSGGYGQYSYNTPAVLGNNVDGKATDGDISIGYQHYIGTTRLSAYLGGSVENDNLSPRDPNARTVGTRGGVRGQAEIFSMLTPQIPALVFGTYTTGFRSYYSQGTVGYNFGAFTLGPQIGFQGNQSYNEQRYGARLSGIDLGFATVAFSGGGEHSDRNNASGVFGAIGFDKIF